jgi:hypothetical protein
MIFETKHDLLQFASYHIYFAQLFQQSFMIFWYSEMLLNI